MTVLMSDAASAPLTPPRTILYTGSSGRLGLHVIPLLQARGYEVIGADLGNHNPAVTCFRELDLVNFDRVMEVCEGVDAIVHCAIASSRALGVADEETTPQEEKLLFDHTSFDVNVKGTYNLYEAARRHGIRRVIFMSSLTTVLAWPDRPIPPNVLPAPRNVYACTKLFGEQLAEVFNRTLGMSIISLRLGQPYPLNVSKEKLWLGTERGRATYVAHEDTVEAIYCALNHPAPEGGLFTVTSVSDVPVYDHTAGLAFGFQPRFKVMEDGSLVPVRDPA